MTTASIRIDEDPQHPDRKRFTWNGDPDGFVTISPEAHDLFLELYPSMPWVLGRVTDSAQGHPRYIRLDHHWSLGRRLGWMIWRGWYLAWMKWCEHWRVLRILWGIDRSHRIEIKPID